MSKQFKKITQCADRSYHHFTEFVKTAINKGYYMAGFGEMEKHRLYKKSVIMRHDIDFSLKSAVTLAGIEDMLKVSATYFISIHRPHYTPLTREMRKTVHTLLEHGHEIGLHYEPDFDNLQAEIDLLETYLDCKITAIARHNPFGNRIDIDSNSKPRGVIDAYSKEIMTNFKYLSDSSGIWREGCFCGWIGMSNKYQVLIHPEWWAAETIDPVAQLRMINDNWLSSQRLVAGEAVRNLEIHRGKIKDGQA